MHLFQSILKEFYQSLFFISSCNFKDFVDIFLCVNSARQPFNLRLTS